MPSLTDTISLNTTIGAIQSAHTTACILGHGDSAREHQRWGAPNAAHEPRRFLGVGSMRLFGPNRTAALLGVNLGL